jgi:hypothetical protein
MCNRVQALKFGIVRCGLPAAAFAFWLSCLSPPPLGAQAPIYDSGSGRTAVVGYFDPLHPAAGAPLQTPAQSLTLPFMPVVPPADYAAQKAAMAPYVKPGFPLPPSVETTMQGVLPRVPAAVSPIAAAPTVSFQGPADTLQDPASPEIAAGPSDVLIVVNTRNLNPGIAQYSRAGVLKKQTSFQEWFTTVIPTVCPGGLSSCVIYDPCLRYDQLHGRFLFLATATDFSAQRSNLLLSISNGATYDSGWTIWVMNAKLDGSTQTNNWADFWRLGFDNAAVYLSGNMYSFSGGTGGIFQYAKIRVVKKSELYKPGTTVLNFKDVFNMKNDDAAGTTPATPASSLAPAHLRGRPAAQGTEYFVNSSHAPPATFLTVWKINDPLADTLTLTRSTVRSLLSYSAPASAPQFPSFYYLDSGDTRVLKVVNRNGYLYAARDTGYPDAPITVTYDLIDTSNMTSVAQTRVMNANAFYPAFDVPANTPSGTPLDPSNVIYGTTTAADGTQAFAGISRLKAGEGIFARSLMPGAVSRWGDYFGGAVDPINGGLWTSGQYAKPQTAGQGLSSWGTWAGYFPWNTTQSYTDVPSTSPYFNFVNVLSLWQITNGCSATGPKYCPGDNVTRGQLAVFIIRAMFGDTFQYNTTPYFTDVAANDPFFSYIQKLRDLGITSGCTATKFCPGDPVNRWSASVLIVRAKMAALLGDNFTYPAAATFGDVPTTHMGFQWVQKMAELGITGGCTPPNFCPSDPVTREQMAVFITRAFLN